MTEGGGFERLGAACAAVRLRAVLATVGSVLAGAALVVLALSLFPAGLREGRGSFVPLVLALVVWTLAACAVWWLRLVSRTLRPAALAEEVDQGVGLGAGDVRAALELQRPTDSPGAGLAAFHRARVAERLSGPPPDGLLPETGPRWRLRSRRAALAVAAAFVLLSLSALARPQPTRSAALALGAPWRTAFPPALPELEIRAEPGAPRGEPAELTITAVGRERVRLATRTAGAVIARRDLTIPAGGVRLARTEPIDAPTRVWIEDEGGGSSDTLLIRPLEPLLVQDVMIQVEYPGYLGREAETHRGQIPPLVAPEGTRLVLSGETNLSLDRGSLRRVEVPGEPATRPGEDVPLDIAGSRFGATWVPVRTGRWAWSLEAEGSIGAPILPEPIRVLVVPDLMPRFQLLYPGPDTTLGFEKVMPLVVDVEDDIGLRSVALRTWRSGLGAERGERREPLSPGPDGSRRAVFRHLLDRSADDLLPGDTVFYRFEAFDGHPGRGPALSEVFLLRVPTFAEISEARAEQTEDLADAAESLEEALASLAEAAADAARQADAESEEAGFEATEEARAVLDEAERAREGMSELEEDLASLREGLSESALGDPTLEEQLERLAERYEELADEGLIEEMDALADALRDLDPEALREALEALAENSEELREQLEQTLGMLDQAALEQALKSAQTNADELAESQRQLAEETASESFEQDQAALAEQAEEMAEALADLERQLAEADRATAADSAAAAGERTEEAIQNMQAAQSGEAGESTQGGSERQAAAEQAAEALEQAASALGSAQQDLSGESGEAAVETLARARSEALSLADEEGRLADATRGDETADPEEWRGRQGAVRQGLENLLERLSEAGNEAAMLDQATGAAAGEAAERMDRLLERLAQDGARRLPSRAEAEGIQNSLNQLAQQLLSSEQAARAGQQQSAGEQAAEQMAQMAQQQQAVTQETSSLLMPGPKPAGQEQIREQLARRQEEIADQLGELEDPEGDLLARPEELAEEAAELARQLELDGPTQETLERQRRLFRRMLDAGRSLEDEDLDPNRRESQTGEAAPREPPPIDPALLEGRRFPLPSEAELRELPLLYRALIFDYFDRLNRIPVPTPPASRRDP